jgi:AcrR family transcriptional regulator
VVEQAGVSRATFYQHFRNREECFLAAYREAVAAVRARLERAGAVALEDRRREALGLLLDAAAERPAAARLVLIEALAAPPPVRREHDRFLRDCEAWVEASLPPDSLLPASALLGALTGVVSARLLAGEAATLPGLCEPLLDWAGFYAAPPASLWSAASWRQLGRDFAPILPAPAPRGPSLLPRGASALAPSHVAADRRQRIVDATARVAAARGYSALTVADVVATARVPRRAFYSHFRGKEDAFLAAQTRGLQGSIAAAAAAFSVEDTWPDAVWRAGEALLAYLAAHPDLARLGIVEIYAVGDPALRRNEDSRLAYGLFLERGYLESSRARALRPLCTEAIGSALFGLMRLQLARRELETLPSLLPLAVYLILAPFIGSEAALDLVVARARAAGPAPRTGSSH